MGNVWTNSTSKMVCTQWHKGHVDIDMGNCPIILAPPSDWYTHSVMFSSISFEQLWKKCTKILFDKVRNKEKLWVVMRFEPHPCSPKYDRVTMSSTMWLPGLTMWSVMIWQLNSDINRKRPFMKNLLNINLQWKYSKNLFKEVSRWKRTQCLPSCTRHCCVKHFRVPVNKIAFKIRAGIDDWTAERAIIASNENSTCGSG